MGSAEFPLVDQVSQEVSHCVWRDQLLRLVGMTESWHVQGNDSANSGYLVPDSPIRPQGLWPRRQHQHDRIGLLPGVGVSNPRSLTHSKIGRDFGRSRMTHVL